MLALSNEVFKRQFFGDFQDGKSQEIEVDADPASFQQFLDFLNYCETDILPENLREVYALADRYLEEKLKDLCADRIVFMISYKNVFSTASWNYLYENEKVKAATQDYFSKNQMACLLTDHDGFTTLSKEEILQIVKMNPLNCSEELLLRRILEWMKVNKDQTIEDLLPYIRLKLDENYNILDVLTKPSRPNTFAKRNIGELKLSNKLVSTNEFYLSDSMCFGFSIILSNYNRTTDYMEKFNLQIKNHTDNVILLNRDFSTHVEEYTTVREFVFDKPLIVKYEKTKDIVFDVAEKTKTITFDVTFKKRVSRYHYNNKVIFPYQWSNLNMLEMFLPEMN